MKNKVLVLTVLLFTSINCFSQSSGENLKLRFLKGNIQEKTQAIKLAAGAEKEWCAYNALNFAQEYKETIGNDTELDDLVVTAVLAIPESFDNSDSISKLFQTFNMSSAVQIAILSKIQDLHQTFADSSFTRLLNSDFSKNDLNTIDESVVNAELETLSKIGNSESFVIIFNYLSNSVYPKYNDRFTETLTQLLPKSIDEAIAILHSQDLNKLKITFKIAENSKISQNFYCEIAENTLSQSILLSEDTTKVDTELSNIQTKSLKILSDNNWTRASATAVSYFKFAKAGYVAGIIPEQNFIETIKCLNKVAPIASVTPLCVFLEEFNSQTSKGRSTPTELVKAVINTLGAIGDKTAFDSLLAVTYLNYPESVLSAAREALAGLRW